jgi:lipopolysaccharide export system permease protein
MRTLNRLINREATVAVGFVTLAFLSLMLFFDIVDDLQYIGRYGNQYEFKHVIQYGLLQVPAHTYELLPITVLIGTIFVMARLASSSEFTILRTSGLGPWRALKQLMKLGLAFAIATLVIGDYIAPAADKTGQLLKARYQGLITTGLTGAWLRETQEKGNATVNVRNMGADQQLLGVRVFEFDANGQVRALRDAKVARVAADGTHWTLEGVEVSEFAAGNPNAVNRRSEANAVWPTNIDTDMIAAALLRPERMRTFDLYQYMTHLKANGQDSQRFEIEFWRKLLYPLSCVVMVALALPFAYLHFRSGGITGYVFLGVLIGISFFLLNNMFGFIGNISDWEPWLAASIPSLLYFGIAMGGFAWLVIKK